MAPSSKGKEKVIAGGKGSAKRKSGYDDDKTGGRKRRNRGVIQFIEDAAFEVGEDDYSDSDDFSSDEDSLEDEFQSGDKFQTEPSRVPFPSRVPKEEEPTEEELEKLLQERYKPGSSFVTYAEDNYESKRSIDSNECWPSVKEPTIWKVKCVVGRERHSAFCLMQKYVDLKYLGNKLQIISAFSIDHIKGFIYIEAEKERDIYEACNGLCNIYSSRVAPVPKDDVSHLFAIRSKGNGISEGMWARVKSGKYKGDLAQIAAVNDARKKVTIKLIPRVDLQALAEKFGRGTTANRAVTPAPRLISSSELEDFRPLIQFRRDRDTNKFFEVLDGMMLKDGYLYKKVPVDSLSLWGVMPTDDELLKFEPSKNDECKDLEWLSQLYGERKKKRPLISDKGGGKGDGSSSSSMDNSFEVPDLVFFGRKDFGVIIGTEKDESFKIIKEGSEGPVVVTLQQRELKNASFDKKLFTALDQLKKNISINDTVRVLEGPLKDREGTVKRIYRGIIFLYNESAEENNGYFCIKAQMCEKVELPGEACNEKGGEPCPSGFGDFPSSPKSPLSPKQSDQGRDGGRDFKREDDAMFSVGQSLRIRLGPLKGYLCRVLAIRRSDVTVKLDSQHKILTVKSEHLSEVRAKSVGICLGEDSDSLKPFDLLETQDGSRDWMDGASKRVEGGNWNAEGFSTERSSWPSFPASNFSLQPESQSSIPLNSVDDDANKGTSWEAKTTPSKGTSWGTSAAARDPISESGQVDGWGNQEDSSKKGAFSTGFGSNASDSWGKAVDPHGQTTGDLNIKNDCSESKSAWNASGVASARPMVGWGNTRESSDTPKATPWNKATTSDEGQTDSWAASKKDREGTGVWGKDAETSTWNQTAGVTGGSSSWNQNAKPSCSEQGGGSSWSKPGGGSSSWSKQGGESSWSKPGGGSSSWSKQGGGSSWSKQEAGSAPWSKEDGAMENKCDIDQHGSRGMSESFNRSRGSGGRRGRGGGQGGRGQFGRERSFGQGGTSSWTKGDQDDDGGSRFGTFEVNNSCWDKNTSFNQVKGEDSWDKPNASSGDGSKRTQGWGSNKGTGEWGAKSGTGWSGGRANDPDGDSGLAGDESSGWQNKGKFSSSKLSDGALSSGWNKKSVSVEQKCESKDQGDTWNDGGVSTANQASGWGKGTSDSGREQPGWDNKSGAKTADNQSSGWNTRSTASQEAGGSVVGGSGWERRETPAENSKSSWRTSTSSLDGNQSSALGSKSNWDTQKTSVDNTSDWDQKSAGNKMNVEVDKGGAWNDKKTSDGGSSSGWGQSKWSGAANAGGGSNSGWGPSKWNGAADGGGNENSWSGKSNWKSDNNFGRSEEQTDTFGERGRGGNWRGGRGGRWGQDRGGFGGGGGSGSGGFGGRGRSDRGRGFGGRGQSGRGDFVGRDGSDRGGFRGRGGFGGRGRGRRDDWNKNDPTEDNTTYSWNNTSNKDVSWTSNSSGGNWGRGVGDKGQWQGGSTGWNVSEGAAAHGNDAQSGGWNKGVGSSKDAGGNDAQDSGWNCEGSHWKAKDVSTSEKRESWKNGSGNTSQGWGSNNNGDNWHSDGSDKKQWQSSCSDWKSSKEPAQGMDIEQAGGWTRGPSLSKDIGGSNGKTSGWKSNESNLKTSNSSGEATSSGWNQPAPGEGTGSPADDWGKAAASSWAHKNDGNGKRGW